MHNTGSAERLTCTAAQGSVVMCAVTAWEVLTLQLLLLRCGMRRSSYQRPLPVLSSGADGDRSVQGGGGVCLGTRKPPCMRHWPWPDYMPVRKHQKVLVNTLSYIKQAE